MPGHIGLAHALLNHQFSDKLMPVTELCDSCPHGRQISCTVARLLCGNQGVFWSVP